LFFVHARVILPFLIIFQCINTLAGPDELFNGSDLKSVKATYFWKQLSDKHAIEIIEKSEYRNSN
jgi:hypothetical protein